MRKLAQCKILHLHGFWVVDFLTCFLMIPIISYNSLSRHSCAVRWLGFIVSALTDVFRGCIWQLCIYLPLRNERCK